MTFVSPKVLASWTPTIHPGDPNMIQIDFDSFGFEAFVASTVNWPEISVDSNAIKKSLHGTPSWDPKVCLWSSICNFSPDMAKIGDLNIPTSVWCHDISCIRSFLFFQLSRSIFWLKNQLNLIKNYIRFE